MTLTDHDTREATIADGAPRLYCLAAMVADEASQSGYRDFARALEAAMAGLLAALPAEQQASALRLSYDLAIGLADGGGASPPPRLRLVSSR